MKLILFCLALILLAFGAVWVVVNIVTIIKILLPLAVLASVVAGLLLGKKIWGR